MKIYNPKEEIVNGFEGNILYDDKKVEDLAKNLFHKLNYSDTNALTVGIVGDWGIGKTSFMNLLLNYLYKQEGGTNKKEFSNIINKNGLVKLSENYYIMKINSWLLEKSTIQSEYIIVDYLLREINKNLGSTLKSIFNTIQNADFEVEIPFFKVGIKGEKLTTKLIVDFIDKFNEIINNFLGNNEKIILIIDDLDRIPPQEAIAIMDSIKLFLDNEHFIVFFLNDKRIINEGLREKFGENIGKNIANEYLDKLMQIDIKLKKYLDTEDYKKGIINFIQNHPYIKAKVPGLVDKLKENENSKLFKEIVNLQNFRKVKKLFRNLQVQGPSLYKDNTDEGRLNSVIKYLEEEIIKKDNNNS